LPTGANKIEYELLDCLCYQSSVKDICLKLSVIIPVYNGGENFRRCLDALRASLRAPEQVIVVDDASIDHSADVAREYGVELIELQDQHRSAAHARNCGAVQARGDVLVFIDADVAVHADTLARIEQTLNEHPEVAAFFGSYDDHPFAPGWVSRYKNLLHHYVHQHGAREASTFWTGCVAIRRQVFEQSNGFSDQWLAIEDIELGYRLRQAEHRIWLCPGIQATHLKAWTLSSLIRSDIFDRAIPWSHLILSQHELPNTLNLDWSNRVSAMCACAELGLSWVGFFYPLAWIGAGVAGLGLILVNFDLYKFFFKEGGIGFMVVAVLLHWLYLLYSTLVFGILFVLNLGKSRNA
jgi:glycosyltransferase involved in cell wall biosynthesis